MLILMITAANEPVPYRVACQCTHRFADSSSSMLYLWLAMLRPHLRACGSLLPRGGARYLTQWSPCHSHYKARKLQVTKSGWCAGIKQVALDQAVVQGDGSARFVGSHGDFYVGVQLDRSPQEVHLGGVFSST